MDALTRDAIEELARVAPNVSMGGDRLTVDDIYHLENALPPRFRPHASVLFSEATHDVILALPPVWIWAGADARPWPATPDPNGLGDDEPVRRLLGYPIIVVSEMPEHVVMVMGDFHYWRATAKYPVAFRILVAHGWTGQ